VIGDFPWTRPHWSKIEKYIESSYFSKWETYRCSGKRRYFTIPAEKGDAKSNSQGVDRAVAWSPDGKSVSWFSDEAENINWLFQINLEEQKIRLQ
jgi:tricorn protease